MAALEVEPLPDWPPLIGYPLASLERTRRYLISSLDQIDQNALDRTPSGHRGSVATLLYHIAVIEMDWIFTRMLGRDRRDNGIPDCPDHILPYLPYQPFDDEDGAAHTPVSGERLATHLDRLTATRNELKDTYRPMSVEEFRSPAGKAERTYTPEWVIEHLIQHEAEPWSGQGNPSRRGARRVTPVLDSEDTMSDIIEHQEFTERLAALCIGGSAGLPRRLRDRHIVLASATLWMEPGAVYTEPEINAGLSRWLECACPSLDLDVATLRRELVNHLYLDRDDSGSHYSPGAGHPDWRFGDDVADVDPAEVIGEAIQLRKARRAAQMNRDD